MEPIESSSQPASHFHYSAEEEQSFPPSTVHKGVTAKNLVYIVDFIYLEEASIYQEDLHGFLALAESLQLKGLAGIQVN